MLLLLGNKRCLSVAAEEGQVKGSFQILLRPTIKSQLKIRNHVNWGSEEFSLFQVLWAISGAEFHLYQMVNLYEQNQKKMYIKKQTKKKNKCGGRGKKEKQALPKLSVFREQEFLFY